MAKIKQQKFTYTLSALGAGFIENISRIAGNLYVY